MSFNYSIITLICEDKCLFLSEKINYYYFYLTYDVWGPRALAVPTDQEVHAAGMFSGMRDVKVLSIQEEQAVPMLRLVRCLWKLSLL